MDVVRLKTSEEIYQQALTLRYDLFFRGPNLPKDILFDELEESSVHVAIIEENELYAYGRLSELEKGIFKVSQMVVRPNMQGKGLGTRVLAELVNIRAAEGAIEIFLNARLHAVSMY